MLCLPGSAALSAFRLQRLEEELAARIDGLDHVHAFHLHFVDTARELEAAERDRLEVLLDHADSEPLGDPDDLSLCVIPRPGTVSPWSSKATDILHNCGLGAVRRVERGTAWHIEAEGRMLGADELAPHADLLHDRMTEVVIDETGAAEALFAHHAPERLTHISLGSDPQRAIALASEAHGLALADDEIAYLAEQYTALGRDPTDVELMMFAQANSEHCRHKIFRADWTIDGVAQDASLFDMIRATYKASPEGILSAYHDNAAVLDGPDVRRFLVDPDSGRYCHHDERAPIQIKVETHNHPTAISPFPGAATGAGGEIRDEAATGRGARPKAGLCGFSVSNLRIPGFVQPWERERGRPARLASALDIMLAGPIGAAAFNNEFGRPNICGYFRTWEEEVPGHDGPELRGYHKPIMIAGGLGNIRPQLVDKQKIPPAARVIVLGGPAMRIGLGGGAASSMASGTSSAELDFASVQRGNPEMQRRAQEVIERCTARGEDNPILSIHDVGAGGLSNAIPELLDDAGVGGQLELREIPNDEPGMSPLAIWCNESQERYVLAIRPDAIPAFTALCARERCPWADLGTATAERHLRMTDRELTDTPVDVPLDLLLGKPPRMHRVGERRPRTGSALTTAEVDLDEAIDRVLHLPAVASKEFLISIGDRTVGGMVHRDQMVGPWQVPVADCGVTLSGYQGYTGEALAMGERTPLALLDGPKSGRMAVAEAVTNIAAAPVQALQDIRLSANWMAATGEPAEDADLFDTVQAVGAELCTRLGIAIPVGKDSLSMQTVWEDDDGSRQRMRAPISLIVSAFAPVSDVRLSLTPQLRLDRGATRLWLLDLGAGRNRLGGSALAQVWNRLGTEAPDIDDPEHLRAFFAAVSALRDEGLLLAYHDRSDGGLLVTLLEMAFAGRCGLDVDIATLGSDTLAALFSEEAGAVIQIAAEDADALRSRLVDAGIADWVHDLGEPTANGQVVIRRGQETIYQAETADLHARWHETSYQLQRLRDNPRMAEEQYETIRAGDDPGLSVQLTFDPRTDVTAPSIRRHERPQVAILREQGVNGQNEMAAAFDRAGFAAIDVHMSDLLAERTSLAGFSGIVACGGFSFGDVLGAGGGWARSILYNQRTRDEFAAFFAREDTFALGVCNGCQMLSQLRELIPGTDHWPEFVRNRCEQFEARLALVEVMESPSLFLAGMAGSRLPIAVAHGEGRASWGGGGPTSLEPVALRYVDPWGQATETYPWNPNGSACGVTGVTNTNGRVLALMPHPERVFRTVQHSWHPGDWGEDGPWLRMFRNARLWVD